MKDLKWVKDNLDSIDGDFIDNRFTKRFLDFLPLEEFEKIGYEYTGDKEKRTVKEWNEENVLAQLKKDVEFGIEKAVNHRSISAELMFEVCKSWCIVLENGLENTDYGYYGHKMFETLDKYYNFGLVKEDTFTGDFFGDWS